ncbi:hypothetical protein ACOMHN_008736 [Nucella lapillus]
MVGAGENCLQRRGVKSVSAPQAASQLNEVPELVMKAACQDGWVNFSVTGLVSNSRTGEMKSCHVCTMSKPSENVIRSQPSSDDDARSPDDVQESLTSCFE